VVLRKLYKDGKQQKVIENPYYIIWELIRINIPERLKNIPYEEIISILKEALTMYGSEKVYKYVPQENIIVQFKF